MAGPKELLLGGIGHCISWASPGPHPKEEPEKTRSLEVFIGNLIARKYRELTALLALFGELLVDDDALRERCRREVSTRNDRLPRWIAGLPHARVSRVMRRTDVLGDGDELVVSLTLADATELILSVLLDHNRLSSVIDFQLLTGPSESVVVPSPSDTAFVDMDPADARAWIENGLRFERYARRPKEWRDFAPIVRWMISRLPEGGVAYEKPHWDEDAVTELLDDFFATPAGAPFADDDYRDVLLELCESGFGDPLRWSTFRISDILRLPYHDEHVPLEIALDAPALLRAFVPFAHSRSGIGQDITGDALKTIDDMSRGYRRRLLDDAMVYYDEGDADPRPWRSYPDQAS
ncbi:hypothetical protein GCM10023114_58450 [Mycolicibacterium sediminis]|uniref:Uncharacterized protein n=2 Tax=Mycolicibacterium sediminis TaxID=1286180 RepID=A0A7I7QP61_9MYCO|nr:hypothetical protein MSEDJ_22590 [Mycolicibacterium sediminis]